MKQQISHAGVQRACVRVRAYVCTTRAKNCSWPCVHLCEAVQICLVCYFQLVSLTMRNAD